MMISPMGTLKKRVSRRYISGSNHVSLSKVEHPSLRLLEVVRDTKHLPEVAALKAGLFFTKINDVDAFYPGVS